MKKNIKRKVEGTGIISRELRLHLETEKKPGFKVGSLLLRKTCLGYLQDEQIQVIEAKPVK